MNRYLAALLVVVGVVGLLGVLALGTGFANYEKAAGAKCSESTLPGTYSVKANCTGTFTFTNGTRYDIFIAPDGSMFTFVHTNPELVSSSFEQRGSSKRVGE